TAGAVVLAALLAGPALAKRHDPDDDEFPNYNKLEYAKPLPPVDQQVPEPRPGSFHLRVGDKTKAQETTMDDLPVQLMGEKRKSEESGPPLDFASAEIQVVPSTPTVSPSTTTK